MTKKSLSGEDVEENTLSKGRSNGSSMEPILAPSRNSKTTITGLKYNRIRVMEDEDELDTADAEGPAKLWEAFGILFC